MITNPAYRQDPAIEAIRQALEVMDEVVIVCGGQTDMKTIIQRFPMDFGTRVFAYFLGWPQPEWTYDELPLHLNHGLDYAITQRNPDWVLKFDADTFIHENDKTTLRAALQKAKDNNMRVATLEKYQFHLATKCYEKGKMPMAINVGKYKDMCYGFNKDKHTDLCQPIIIDNKDPYSFQLIGKSKHPVAVGHTVPKEKVFNTGLHAWNYDYTFKTAERSRELLYHFDRAHAHVFGWGYTGLNLGEITPQTAMVDFLKMTRNRARRATKEFRLNDHPKWVKPLIADLEEQQFGYNLWHNLNPKDL